MRRPTITNNGMSLWTVQCGLLWEDPPIDLDWDVAVDVAEVVIVENVLPIDDKALPSVAVVMLVSWDEVCVLKWEI